MGQKPRFATCSLGTGRSCVCIHSFIRLLIHAFIHSLTHHLFAHSSLSPYHTEPRYMLASATPAPSKLFVGKLFDSSEPIPSSLGCFKDDATT